jgi:hypothetical protein
MVVVPKWFFIEKKNSCGFVLLLLILLGWKIITANKGEKKTVERGGDLGTEKL